MKKILITLMSIISLTFIIVGCSSNDKLDDNHNQETSIPDESDPETTDNDGTTNNNSGDTDVETSTDNTEQAKANTLTALEVADLMGNGINLGNTMEAYGRNHLGTDADVSSYETSWGQPITSQEMVSGMKDAGFDTLRIPVAWTNTMNYENGDYTIRTEYMDRVEEIVNYALNEDMYVIINDHWDGGWWGMFGSSTPATQEKAMDLYSHMWSQIAERFKDYSYKLVFESANEELGHRLNDRDVAEDSGHLSEDECYTFTNDINQTFVDLIRSTGGNNIDRFLLIAGFNTDFTMTLDDRYDMPSDSASNKLLLSVHYYTPWSYCGTDSVNSWGTEKHYTSQNASFKELSKFTDQGYGIIIGEYGVLHKSDGTLKNNTVDYTRNVLDNCDLYGYVPMLWSTNSFYVKEELRIHDDDLAKLFHERSLSANSDLSSDEIKQMAIESMNRALDMAVENDKNNPEATPLPDGDAVAWIMFNSADYNVTYSVGDIYDPTLKSEGITATDVIIKEAGTYTVELDFSKTEQGYANSTSFSALGIYNGELLYPDYIITIEEVLVNGQPYKLKGLPYTTSDDDLCTRVNLYNSWVTEIPENIRLLNNNMASFVTATPLDPLDLDVIQTLSVSFSYQPVD